MYELGEPEAPGTPPADPKLTALANLISAGGAAGADILRAKAGLPPAAKEEAAKEEAAGKSNNMGMALGLLAAAGLVAYLIYSSAKKAPAARKRKR